MRCLEPAAPCFAIDAREFDQPGGGEELERPYVATGVDLAAWAATRSRSRCRRSLCRADCAGLCPVCGENLNEGPGHEHESAPDPRWAKLRELEFDDARYPSAPHGRPEAEAVARAHRKRRAQHKISAPAVNACPQCHSPRLPHRVCPTAGPTRVARSCRARPRPRPRPLVPRSRSRSTRTAPTSVRPRSRRGAARAPSAACACCCSAPPGRSARSPTASRWSTRRSRSPRRPTRRAPSARTPEASIVRAARAVAEGRRRRARLGRLDRRGAGRRRCSNIKRARGIHRPALAISCRCRAPGAAARRRRQRRGAARAPRPVRLHGRGLRAGRARRGAPARRAALQRRGGEQGHADVVAAHERAGGLGRAELRRQRRGHAMATGAADVVVTDGFTGNIALKLMEGVVGEDAARDPRRPRVVAAREARRAAAAARAARAARRDRPGGAGGALLLGLRRLGVVPHGAFRAPASQQRSCSPRAACARTSSGARTRRWRPRGRCAGPGVRDGG